MGAQRFRTPRALDLIKERTGTAHHNIALAMLREVFQSHTTVTSFNADPGATPAGITYPNTTYPAPLPQSLGCNRPMTETDPQYLARGCNGHKGRDSQQHCENGVDDYLGLAQIVVKVVA